MRWIILLCCLQTNALLAAETVSQPLDEVVIYPERSASAQVVSLNESRVAAELSARIVQIHVEPGQLLRKGDVIAQLDCVDYQIATERAEAALKMSKANARLAEVQLTRNRKLADQKFISASGLDTQLAQTEAAQAEVAVNRAALKTAKNNQSKCRIYAPFPAVVLERIAQVGEMAAPGSALVLLRDTSSLEVRADIQEKDAMLEGVNAFKLVTQNGQYPVTLLRLSSALNRNTRLMEARFRFKDQTAPSGVSGRLVWQSPVPHLPANLVVRRKGQLGVFLLADDRPVFYSLPEAEEGRPAAILSTLLKRRIVTKGYDAL